MTTLRLVWQKLQLMARAVSRGLLPATRTLGRALKAAPAALFGQWQWKPPVWVRSVALEIRQGRVYFRAHPMHGVALSAFLIASVAGSWWFVTRPKPHYVTFSVGAPGLTEYDQNGVSSIKPLVVVFNEPAAPLKLVEKTVPGGIALEPAVGGNWFWTSDRELRFTPENDWPIDGEFRVRVARDAVAPGVRLEEYGFEFRTEKFTAQIFDNQFYQDPRDPNLKKLVATIRFSHPVDPSALEPRVTLVPAKEAEFLGLTAESRHFTVNYDKFRLNAFVHSAALPVPRDDTPLTLHIGRGLRAARGGNDTIADLDSAITIPGRSSLRFDNTQMTVVDNARYEPEQILMLRSSTPVTDRAFAGKIAMYLLPARHPNQQAEDRRLYDWRGDEIGADILGKAQQIPMTYVPSDESGNTSHGFKFLAPVRRYVHVVIQGGVPGLGGYVSGKTQVFTVRVTPYRRALTFLGQGALLSMSGDRRIGFLVRDVRSVDLEIARVLPNQLHHVAPQMWDFSKPNIYSHLEDQVTDRVTTTRVYDTARPGKPNYDSLDLSTQMQDGTRRGLFLLHLKAGYTPRSPEEENDSEEEEERDSSEDGTLEDTRLVLVTDLGVIVKQAKDGSRDVFVQSLRTGLPVGGARVSLVGSNGEPVLTSTTDANGRATLGVASQFVREKRPILVLAETDRDLSFLPFDANGRSLDLSRFDTGGVENAENAQQISAYLFSDRGIYRPGESTHLGLVARTADWKASLTGLPIEVRIEDPRGTLVSVQPLKLSPSSFEELTYTTAATAPTGTYQAVAYLTRDIRRPILLGSTSFRVQEFEPDRMKVQLELSSQSGGGWLRPDDVRARVNVAHLFGEPAAGRRVSGEMNLSAALPRFTRFADYRFQIGERLNEPYHEELSAVSADDGGNAELTLDLRRFTGRAYQLNVLARAFEAEGGRSVAVQSSAIVSDATYLVGVRGDGNLSYVSRGTVRDSRWIAVNQQLDPVAAGNLTLEWVQRKYVSVLTQQSNGTFKYVSRLREVIRDAKPLSIAVGGSRVPLPTQEPGDFALVVRDNSGAELNALSYSVAGQANLTRSLERNTELQVQLDKASYGGGETIEVNIRAPYIGGGLITVERERVIAFKWFKTTTTSAVERITLPADFEGNGYVNVQFLRDPASDELFMSPLSFGVAPFAPNLDARRQTLTLTVPPLVKPGTPLSVRVTPAEASRVALIAVDEGILQVARYRNPDPLGYFFQKRMLEVDTRQILDLLLPDFKRFQALSAAGGDADGGLARHLNPFNRKRKPPVAYWSGLVDVGPQGRVFRYDVPDHFNGRLRVVAVAVSPHRIAVTDAATEVKGDFILTPNVPAMMAPGDEVVVSVGVFNNTTGGSGPIHLEARAGDGLEIVGASSIDLPIAEKKEAVGELRLRALQRLGAASVTFSARRATAEARAEESISVRPAVPYRSHLSLGTIDGAAAVAPLTRDMFGELRKVDAAVSAVPLAWGQALTAYLGDYQYTCTEQLVSRGFGALILTSRPELGVVRSREERPLDETVAMLRNRSNEEGGFGLWSSTPETSEYATIHAAHFLIEAKERGQQVPPDLTAAVNEWLTRYAMTPANTLADGRMRAYAVYLLVRQGLKPNAAIANVEQELTNRHAPAWTTNLAAAYLAASYRLMQRTQDAERIIRTVPWSSDRSVTLDGFYNNGAMHDAQLLYLLSRHFPTRATAVPPATLANIGRDLSGTLASSLSAAYALLAFDAYSNVSVATTGFDVKEADRQNRERALTLSPGVVGRAAVSQSAARVQFAKRGPAPGFYALNEAGFDRTVPTTATSQGLEITREFVDAKGVVLTRATVGQEFFARLRLRTTTTGAQSQVAVIDLLPGGVEPILELRPAPADSGEPGDDPAMARDASAARALPIGVAALSDWHPYEVDLREDRLVLYGDAQRTSATFVYRVRATNAGVFQIPPAFAEAMYNRGLTATSPVGRLEIVKQ